MPCTAHRDEDGWHWIVNEERTFPRVDCWWNRSAHKWDGKSPAENLVIRQQNLEGNADVIVLTFGQVYDLIDALTRAVHEP